MGGRLDTAHFHEAQVLVVAAAGNSGDEPRYDPIKHCKAYYDPVTTPDKLLVGSTTARGALSSFSNYGACVHVQVFFPLRPPAPPTLRRERLQPAAPLATRADVAHVCQPSKPLTSACARPRHTSTQPHPPYILPLA